MYILYIDVYIYYVYTYVCVHTLKFRNTLIQEYIAYSFVKIIRLIYNETSFSKI